VLFIMGLKRMSSPVTARSGIVWAGAGMAVATLVTFIYPGMGNFELIIAAIVVGTIIAWWSGKKVAMTDMPQMIALYNGMGGGAAAAIAAVSCTARLSPMPRPVRSRAGAARPVIMTLAVVGGIIGAISFSGSLIAWAKLQGVLNKTVRFAARSS
jgi:NAD(P) transhydrogenase subunit beta